MKKSIALTLVLTLFTSLFTILVLPVGAVSKTIFVPDDYPTISSAIGNATSGDVIFVKKGIYEEQTLEINKTLSIIGEDVNDTRILLHPPVYNETWILSSVYATLSNAITINANNFRLLNLTILLKPDGYISITGDNNTVIGSNVLSGGSVSGLIINGSYCNVTDNMLDGFISSNGKFNSIVGNSAFNILVGGESGVIGNNTIRQIILSNTSRSFIYKNQIGSPFRFYDGLSALAREDSGIIIEGNSFDNTFSSNDVAAYTYNVKMDNRSENNIFYQNNFENNSRGVGILSTNFNFWDNGVKGNYWEDYTGADANEDGIGDTPYVIDANNLDRYPLISPWMGNLPKEEFTLPQTVIVIFAVIFLILAVVLIVYLKKRHQGHS